MFTRETFSCILTVRMVKAMAFSERLKELRKAARLTQHELSKILQIPRSTIAGYEAANREADYETLKKLAEFFEVSIDYLLGNNEAKLPNHPIQDFNEPKDLEEFLKHSEVMFKGVPLDEEDKQIILDSLKIAYKKVEKMIEMERKAEAAKNKEQED